MLQQKLVQVYAYLLSQIAVSLLEVKQLDICTHLL